jgi:hypothetical protein
MKSAFASLRDNSQDAFSEHSGWDRLACQPEPRGESVARLASRSLARRASEGW